MQVDELIELTRKSIKEFEKIERRKWGIEGGMIELAEQVGDLAKYVMTKEKYYLSDRENNPNYQADNDRIADELADIFFCLVRIADHYGIDLEKALIKTREDELKELNETI